MPVYCFACKNKSNKDPGLSFFRFPKHKERCKKWLIACGLPPQKFSAEYCYNRYRLCSEHFEKSMFLTRNRIDELAVPTLFNRAKTMDPVLHLPAPPKLKAKTMGPVLHLPAPLKLKDVLIVDRVFSYIFGSKMPSIKCCVLGCFDNSSKRHTFPNPKVQRQLFDLWVTQIGNPLFDGKTIDKIRKTYTVCDRHFEDKFKVPGTHRGLDFKAYPTIHLKDDSSDVENILIPTNIIAIINEQTISKPSIINETKISKSSKIDEDVGSQIVNIPGVHCSVYGCNNNINQKNVGNSSGPIIFHRFPQGKDLVSQTVRNIWVKRCNRPDEIDVSTSKVCSAHFVDSDYERDLENESSGLPVRRILKETAFPTVNLWNKDSNIGKTACKRRYQDKQEQARLERNPTIIEDVCDYDLYSEEVVTSTDERVKRKRKSKALAKLRTPVGSEPEPSTSATVNNVEVPQLEVVQNRQPFVSPPPKQKRLNASPSKDLKVYCRLCLNQTTKNQMVCLGDFHDINYPSRTVQFRRNKILQTEMYLRMIKMLMPNFDHTLVYNPIMCNECSTRLQMASDFVEQCMTTQTVIKQYKDSKRPHEKMVSCEDVVLNITPTTSDLSPPEPQSSKKRKIVQSTLVEIQQPSQVVSPNETVEMPEFIEIKIEEDLEEESENMYEVTKEDICNIKNEVDAVSESNLEVSEHASPGHSSVKDRLRVTDRESSNVEIESMDLLPSNIPVIPEFLSSLTEAPFSPSQPYPYVPI